jgi:hypothetical protein
MSLRYDKATMDALAIAVLWMSQDPSIGNLQENGDGMLEVLVQALKKQGYVITHDPTVLPDEKFMAESKALADKFNSKDES